MMVDYWVPILTTYVRKQCTQWMRSIGMLTWWSFLNHLVTSNFVDCWAGVQLKFPGYSTWGECNWSVVVLFRWVGFLEYQYDGSCFPESGNWCLPVGIPEDGVEDGRELRDTVLVMCVKCGYLFIVCIYLFSETLAQVRPYTTIGECFVDANLWL